MNDDSVTWTSNSLWPALDSNGLPTWIRADLRAMPEWAGKSDYRSRRPMVTKVPVRSAERSGAAVTPNRRADRGRTAAVLAAVVVVLVVWRRL